MKLPFRKQISENLFRIRTKIKTNYSALLPHELLLETYSNLDKSQDITKNGHVRARASLMMFKSLSRSPSENSVAAAKSFVIASRMMSPTPDDEYQSTAARNDSTKSVFASELWKKDRTRQIAIASNNQTYTKDSSGIVPTSCEKDVIQIWLRKCNLANWREKNEQMTSKSHFHKPNSEATGLGLGQQP
jgi:hypothetical protein